MRTFKTLAVIFMLFAAITNLHAGDKIKIKLHQPPPNMLGVGDMWNLTLENTTKSDLKIYLTGTATEEKDGLIIEGKSKVFTVKPGRTNYTYNDFSGAEVKYNNGKYKEVILRTGNAPEGSYTICVTAFEESGEIAGMENCIMQTVQQLGSISLISPEDGAEINPEQPMIFTWTPLPKGGPYSLKIVELKGNELPENAIKSSNVVVAGSKSISGSMYQVPSGDAVNFVPGKKYAWQVTSGDVASEVWTYSINSISSLFCEINLVPIENQPCCYKIQVNNNYPYSSVNRVWIFCDGVPFGNCNYLASVSANIGWTVSSFSAGGGDYIYEFIPDSPPATNYFSVGTLCSVSFSDIEYVTFRGSLRYENEAYLSPYFKLYACNNPNANCTSSSVSLVPINNKPCCFDVRVNTNLTGINNVFLSKPVGSVYPQFENATSNSGWNLTELGNGYRWTSSSPVTNNNFSVGTICLNSIGLPANVVCKIYTAENSFCLNTVRVSSCSNNQNNCTCNFSLGDFTVRCTNLPDGNSNLTFALPVTNNSGCTALLNLSAGSYAVTPTTVSPLNTGVNNVLVTINSVPSSVGLIVLNLTLTLPDGQTCNQTVLVENTCGKPDSNCECNPDVKIVVNDVNMLNCGGEFNTFIGSNINFRPLYYCLPDTTCCTGYSVHILDSNGIQVGTTDNLQRSESFSQIFTQRGRYQMIFTFNCGTQTCPCTTYVNVAACNCGNWNDNSGISYYGIFQNDTYEGTIDCNGSLDIPKGISLSLSRYFTCGTPGCTVTYKWKYKRPLIDTYYQESPNNTAIFPITFSQTGKYEIILEAFCGGIKCSSCKVFFVSK